MYYLRMPDMHEQMSVYMDDNIFECVLASDTIIITTATISATLIISKSNAYKYLSFLSTQTRATLAVR